MDECFAFEKVHWDHGQGSGGIFGHPERASVDRRIQRVSEPLAYCVGCRRGLASSRHTPSAPIPGCPLRQAPNTPSLKRDLFPPLAAISAEEPRLGSSTVRSVRLPIPNIQGDGRDHVKYDGPWEENVVRNIQQNHHNDKHPKPSRTPFEPLE